MGKKRLKVSLKRERDGMDQPGGPGMMLGPDGMPLFGGYAHGPASYGPPGSGDYRGFEGPGASGGFAYPAGPGGLSGSGGYPVEGPSGSAPVDALQMQQLGQPQPQAQQAPQMHHHLPQQQHQQHQQQLYHQQPPHHQLQQMGGSGYLSPPQQTQPISHAVLTSDAQPSHAAPASGPEDASAAAEGPLPAIPQ